MDKETNKNNLTEKDIELVASLKEYLEETMPILKNRGWYAEAGNSSRYLQVIYSGIPQNRDFIISMNKAVAGAKKVVEKYEAGTLVSGEAARAQIQVDKIVLDIFDEMGMPEEAYEEFRKNCKSEFTYRKRPRN
ncbi:MAG: hypothetical protein WCS27_12930 [Victivallaceae bacterium]|jgi:hypothetical protein